MDSSQPIQHANRDVQHHRTTGKGNQPGLSTTFAVTIIAAFCINIHAVRDGKVATLAAVYIKKGNRQKSAYRGPKCQKSTYAQSAPEKQPNVPIWLGNKT